MNVNAENKIKNLIARMKLATFQSGTSIEDALKIHCEFTQFYTGADYEKATASSRIDAEKLFNLLEARVAASRAYVHD